MGDKREKMLRQLFIKEGANRRRDLRQMEDFYYHAIYDALRKDRNDETPEGKNSKPTFHKQETFTHRRRRTVHDNGWGTHDLSPPKTMETTNIQDGCSDIWQWRHNPHIGDRNTAHLREIYGNKCDTITVDEDQTRDLLAHMKTRLPPEANVEIQATISMEELEMSVRQGKNAKAPGHVGISHDFLKRKLMAIRHDLLQTVNDMYVGEAILEYQKHGIIYVSRKKDNLRGRKAIGLSRC